MNMDDYFNADARERAALATRFIGERNTHRGDPKPFRMAGWAAFNAATYHPTHRANR